MSDDHPAQVEALTVHGLDEPDTVIVHPNPFVALARAAGSAPSLALVSLVIATATMLSMSAAYDIADEKLYSSHVSNNLGVIRWESGTRLILAGLALVLAVIAGFRYSRDLPATRYTFSADREEAVESTEGTPAPGWVTLLVGSSVVVSGLAVVLNGIVLLLTLHLHESPNYGPPTG